jgi:quercetin dioxygenase-like cupin family protein
MSNREILRTENALVRIMELEGGASTKWHHHSQVRDFFVGLTGIVQVETRNPAGEFLLHPGETAEVEHPQVHRVVNLSSDRSTYLLAQGKGEYDFIEE